MPMKACCVRIDRAERKLVLGMRTDNVNVSSQWTIPAALNALIERDDPEWNADCEGKLRGGE